jgi:hypothetical protein
MERPLLGAKRTFREKLTPEMCQTPRDPHRLVSAQRWPFNSFAKSDTR